MTVLEKIVAKDMYDSITEMNIETENFDMIMDTVMDLDTSIEEDM